jgi:DNA-binding response OmpR family regulator
VSSGSTAKKSEAMFEGSAAAALRPAPKRRLLIVEDDRAIRELLGLHLTNAGYMVVLAADAVVAARILLEDPKSIDLLLVDAKLPYMSGLEFVSTLIADSTLPAIPMILITGHEELAPRADVLDVPCLVKPFTAERLIARVEKSLARASRAQATAEVTVGGKPSLSIEAG